MKKIFSIIAVTTIALCGCTEDDLYNKGASTNSDLHTLYANYADDSQSRINIEGLTLTWAANDKFSVFDNNGTGTSQYVLKSGEGTRKGEFEVMPGGTSTQPAIAVYPNLEGSLTNNTLTVNLPQTYTANESQNIPMIGTLKDNIVTFGHSMAIIKFNITNLPEGFNSIKVQSTHPISGAFQIKDINNSKILSGTAESNKVVIIEDITKDKIFYLPVPATTIGVLDIIATNGKEERTIHSVEQQRFECGKLYTLTKDGLSEQNDFEKMLVKIRFNNKKKISASTVSNNLKKFDSATGSFTDINYDDRQKSNWDPLNHLARLLEFSYAYTDKDNSYYGDENLYNNIVKGFEFWYSKNPKSDNWYYQSISTPQKLTLALVYMRIGKKQIPADLEEKLLVRVLNNEDKSYSFNRVTGANKTDMCLHRINNACLQESESGLNIAMEAAFEPIQYKSGTGTKGEGIRYDNCYFQHECQLYIGGYGDELLKGVTLIGMYAMDTRFAMPEEKKDILAKFMIETYYGVMRNGYMACDALGRGVSRANATSKKGTASFARRMIEIAPKYTQEFQSIIKRMEGSDPSYGVKPSHTHYYVGDYTLHVRPKYTVDVRMVSKFTIRCETLNGENKYGYHISDGCTNILVDGDEYYNIYPVWNWARIPGVTAPQQTPPSYSDKREHGKAIYAGGVSDGLYGATGYMYYDTYKSLNTGANKSWFFFDDEVVCMGNVLTNSSKKVQTTINQCFSRGTVTVNTGKGEEIVGNGSEQNFDNPAWIHQDNIGYVFPKGGNIWVSNVKQSGSWKDINPTQSSSTKQTRSVFSLGFDYNQTGAYIPYAYILVPGLTSATDVAKYTQNNPIEILSNDDNVQSVYHKNLKIWQSVIFYGGESKHDGLTMTANNGCIVMVKETGEGQYKVYVADPMRKKKSITLKFKNKAGIEKTITANYAGTDEYKDAGKTKEFDLNF